MKSTYLAGAAVLVATQVLGQSTGTQLEQAIQTPQLNTPTVQGCYSSAGSLTLNTTYKYNAESYCAGTICGLAGGGFTVAASSEGSQCYCGNSYPPKEALVDDSNCNAICPGYGTAACGGIGFWTVYNTGVNLSVPYDTAEASSATSSGPSATGSTVFVTTTSPAKSGGSSTNTAGIAAGVVVAIVVVVALVGGVFFYMRRRRNQELEDEHRRNAAVNAFMGNQKPPSSSGGFSLTDARLDPVMAQRRMSDGSIADNQDYSRKILRVTNA